MPEPIVSVADFGFIGALALLKDGGTMYVPPGTWHSPPLNLTSNLTIYLAANATMQADPDANWPLVEPLSTYGRGHDHPGPRWAPFLGGTGVVGLTIGGENGTIDGSGMVVKEVNRVVHSAELIRVCAVRRHSARRLYLR